MHKVGLCLSGGSMKISYLTGVVRALEERGVKYTCTVGTSAGAILGAALTTMTAKEFWEDVMTQLKKKSDVFTFSAYKLRGLYSLNKVHEMLKQYVSSNNPRDLEAVSCWIDYTYSSYPINYTSNKDNVTHEQYLFDCMGSSTIPTMMVDEPHWRDKFDGGVKEYLPLAESLKRCEKVIAVMTGPVKDDHFKNKRPWYVPPIFWNIYKTVDPAFQQEVKLGDLCAAQNESDRFLLVHPKTEPHMGLFEVNPSKLQALYEDGYNDGMEMDIPQDYRQSD